MTRAAGLVARGSGLVARGSWLGARGSGLVARGSWLGARGSMLVAPGSGYRGLSWLGAKGLLKSYLFILDEITKPVCELIKLYFNFHFKCKF